MLTIRAVAKAAGVSIATVSNVLTGNRKVSPELEKKVLNTVKRLHYQVDPVASSLKSKTTKTIGFVVSSIDSIFFPEVIKGIERVTEEKNYSVTFFPTNNNFEYEKKYIRILLSNRVDGIIVDSLARENDKEYLQLLSTLHYKEKRVPVVSIERDLTEHHIDSVAVDYLEGAYQATLHLLKQGCKTIAHITGPKNAAWATRRTEGYKKALQDNALPIDESLIREGDFSSISGYVQTKKLLNEGITFDGLFAANDLMAIGAIKAIHEYGLAIPENIKIIGFDNIFISSLLTPSLSTINIPKRRMGEMAAKLLFGKIENCQDKNTENIILPFSLIERNSTNPLKTTNWELY